MRAPGTQRTSRSDPREAMLRAWRRGHGSARVEGPLFDAARQDPGRLLRPSAWRSACRFTFDDTIRLPAPKADAPHVGEGGSAHHGLDANASSAAAT